MKKYMIQIETDEPPTVDPVEAALKTVQTQLSGLQSQQESICEYLEKGIYTIDIFTKRNAALNKEIKQLQQAEADLLRRKAQDNQQKQATAQIIPTTQHILENYPRLNTLEKNQLWKLVMKKATVYRSQDGEVSLHIYPNIPK